MRRNVKQKMTRKEYLRYKKRLKRWRRIRAYCMRFSITAVFVLFIVKSFTFITDAFSDNLYIIKNNSQAYVQKEQESNRIEKIDAMYEKDKFLVLVNKDNMIDKEYVVRLIPAMAERTKVSEDIYDDLMRMLSDGNKEGYEFVIASAYRDAQYQEKLLKDDIRQLQKSGYSYEEAYNEAVRETMPSGYSEHETGLAVDIVAANYQMLDKKQELREENKWLRENCATYGFILRYPKDKESITGISYESWHFRYVGKEAATYIMNNNITLEEYLSL